MNTLEILVHTLEMFINNVHILSTFRTFPRWRLAETYAWLLPIDAIHLIMETPENVFVACHIILPLLWHKYRLKLFPTSYYKKLRIQNQLLILMLVYSDDELRFMYENGQGHLTLFCIVFVWLMWSACHKKRYLLCVELTNFGIFTKPFPIFFQNKQNWDSHTEQRQLISDFRFLISRFVK